MKGTVKVILNDSHHQIIFFSAVINHNIYQQNINTLSICKNTAAGEL